MVPILPLPEIAHQMSLLPLLWLALLHARGVHRDAAWWWIAGAFGVSWLADTAAHWVSPWMVSAVYPVSQSAIIGAVLLGRRDAMAFLGALVCMALLSLFWEGVNGPMILLRTVAW